MDISILISTYKRFDILFETLSSFQKILTSNLSWELLLADNANDLETQKILKFFHDKLPLDFILYKTPQKCSFESISNFSSRPIGFFTDDDVTPNKNWLLELWRALKGVGDILLMMGSPMMPIFNIPLIIFKKTL